MCDYPFFIPQVVLFANSSLFWFKVTNEHREFRNYLQFSISLPYFEIVTKFLQLLCVFMILLFLNNVNIFVAYFFFYRENLIFSTKAAEEKIPSTSDTILPAVLELYNPTLSDVIL